jgi:nucleoside-diphosphate-sugar epimerase
MRVAVFGASGLIGSAVVERLMANPDIEVRPVIHTSASAWRLARRGLEFTLADLHDRESVRAALGPCTHVVNCSRGPEETMIKGLANLLVECQRARVDRFVHLSSVSVYGDSPPASSATEDAPTRPVKGSYGWVKLQQDGMVEAARRRGLSTIILCPPNITGTFSRFLLELLESLAAGRFRLVNGGASPCNVVDANNLAYAVELALATKAAEPGRFFVTDGEPATWHGFVTKLGQCLDPPPQLESIPASAVLSGGDRTNARASLASTLKHLASKDVRSVLRRDPLLAKIDFGLRATFATLPSWVENAVRSRLSSPPTAPISTAPPYDFSFCRMQLRDVRHSCERARNILKYRPVFSTAQSLDAFGRWYRQMYGLDEPCRELLSYLS